ncbi:MAG: FecR domain-containing protein [Bacteriovoracaceae bacterium]
MDRFKIKISKSCGLILLCLCFKVSAQNLGAKLGAVTQLHGEVTFFPFHLPNKLKHLQVNDILNEKGSYLTYEDSFMTVKLFDGSFLRLSPKSKFSLEFNASQKIYTLHLFTGSIKILFSQKLSAGKAEKLIVKSGDTEIETTEGKFSVVANPVMDLVNCYVEKGLVSVISLSQGERKDFAYVHRNETVSVEESNHDVSVPRKISDKELQFLHGSSYLKLEKGEETSP